MSEKKATLHIEGMDPIELPIYSGSAGPDVIDVRQLVSKGLFTYDPGFVSTASCESKITEVEAAENDDEKEEAEPSKKRARKE